MGAGIWAPMPVYQYQNPSGYVTVKYQCLHFEDIGCHWGYFDRSLGLLWGFLI